MVLGVVVSNSHVVICVIETLKQQLIFLANRSARSARDDGLLFGKVSVKVRNISFVVLCKSVENTLVAKNISYLKKNSPTMEQTEVAFCTLHTCAS